MHSTHAMPSLLSDLSMFEKCLIAFFREAATPAILFVCTNMQLARSRMIFSAITLCTTLTLLFYCFEYYFMFCCLHVANFMPNTAFQFSTTGSPLAFIEGMLPVNTHAVIGPTMELKPETLRLVPEIAFTSYT